MEKVYILSATRTPLGSFGGVFKNIEATRLGSIAIKGAIEKAGIRPGQIEEVFIGNVISANLGQAPARQAALGAGIPDTVPCTTVNKVCASGMKAIMFAAQTIQIGHADVVVAGGMESMSRIPYYVPEARFGYKYGGAAFVDGLERDGLADAYDGTAMGISADKTAEKYQISREGQDRFAMRSYQRAAESSEKGWAKHEITPVEVPQRKGEPLFIAEDEEFRRVDFTKIPHLRPAFTQDGTVTAANASTINDGASALILVSETFLKKNNLQPLAEILSYADAAHAPQWFTTAPSKAAPIAMARAQMQTSDIHLWEVNEAFAVVPMAFARDLKIDEENINILGGAVALGHPLGASGARIVTTLINALNIQKKEIGCASICNGGGGASSMIIRKI